MGNQHGLEFTTRVDYMAVSLWQGRSTIYTGRSHACAYLTALTTALSNRTRACHTGMPLPSPSLVQFRKGQF
ncbi:hypothetical protein F383_37668 [Gossypium arboreum]|uniref:Uncharacterized protein n=1 Tax=Gossypium arboreum TaxID=29729 RepID=A0A0B0MCC5_GOSAR|nr:hypothetical protein F383_37668 [Gossypium arboreum]